jgi:hypothetical protein
MAEREKWREQEKLRKEAENRKIEEYARLQRQREENLRNTRQAMDEEKNVIYDKVYNFRLFVIYDLLIFFLDGSLLPRWLSKRRTSLNWKHYVLSFIRPRKRRRPEIEIR